MDSALSEMGWRLGEAAETLGYRGRPDRDRRTITADRLDWADGEIARPPPRDRPGTDLGPTQALTREITRQGITLIVRYRLLDALGSTGSILWNVGK